MNMLAESTAEESPTQEQEARKSCFVGEKGKIKGGVGMMTGIYAAQFSREKPRIFSAGLFYRPKDSIPADQSGEAPVSYG